MSEERVSARRAAELTGRVERTIRRWITSGRLPADRDPVTGQFWISVAALQPYMRDGMEPPAEAESAAESQDIDPRQPSPEFVQIPIRMSAEDWQTRAVAAETKVRVARGLLELGVPTDAVMVVLNA